MSNDVHLDFATILAILTVVTGIGWALDKWWLGPARRAQLPAGVEDRPNSAIDFARSFFPVIALVLLLRSFLAEPFRIPSGSMLPTLLVGDFILVNKFTYGFRDPVFHHKFVSMNKPQRGDVVVFRWPIDPTKDFIKRLIGLPGDHIAYRDKQLFLNGVAMPRVADGVYTAEGSLSAPQIYRYAESLGTVNHHVLANPARPADDFEFVVPEGEYFMMGDNRDGSDDSRRWGTVPERNLVGRAFFIWMSWDAEHFRPDLSRIGTVIR
ncbi:MAG: signal peptidase I [Pseudomonadota bacterium]